MRSTGAIIGTSVSELFLLVIATINIIVLVDIYRTWRKVVRSGTYDDHTLDDYLSQRGVLAHLFRPMLSVVSNC